jgi:hypothetical protein
MSCSPPFFAQQVCFTDENVGIANHEHPMSILTRACFPYRRSHLFYQFQAATRRAR